MDDALTRVFHDFDRGKISRRQLFQVLGVAAAGVAVAPIASFAQGRCGGNNAGRPECDTTPAKAPFDPTGWRTVSLDHFTLQVADYKKEVAYYAALMNWRLRSDDGMQAVMDIGDDIGTVLIRGGYQAPPAPTFTPPPAAAGDSAAGRGRGGRGGGGGAPRVPRNAVWDSFCWGIDNWNATNVEAELKKRGLNPVKSVENGAEMFTVTDPGGFTVKITDGNRKGRRGSGNGIAPSAEKPFESTNWKTVWLDHISFQSPNYKESTAFYQALLGWHPNGDEGSQNECQIGELGNIIIRGGGPARGAAPGATPPRRMSSIDHIAFGIQPWDSDAVKAELDKRGLSARPDTGGTLDIHDPAAKYKSYHTTTPNGFDLQISNATKSTREVR